MSRSELIGSICSVVNSSDYSANQKSNAKLLLERLTARKISEEDAAEQYQSILNEADAYWLDKLKPKAVYESLKRYRSGNLDSIGVAKMVSSLITHGLIEVQKSESASVSSLGLAELSECLSSIINSNLNECSTTQLDEVLAKYRYLQKEGE